MRIEAARLRALIEETFASVGCARDEAERIARYLVAANLVGHDSHGVIRVPRYVSWLQDGTLRAGQSITVITDNEVMALVDGNQGFGQTIGPQAVQLGIDKAKATGVAIVALRSSGHLGRIGDWAEMAIDAGQISIHFVNVRGSLLVAPFGGSERRMSTNPIAIGVPRDDGPPLVLDFATSVVAEGKVLVAHSGGKPLPEGSLIDLDGTLTTDPIVLYGEGDATRSVDVRNGTGAIRAMGEHKGSGLALMCEMLAGALTGGGCAGPAKPPIANGMLSIFMQPEFFDSAHGFAREMADYLAFFQSARPATPGGEVLLPGDPERRNRAEREAQGIPLSDEAWDAILATAREAMGADRAEEILGA